MGGLSVQDDIERLKKRVHVIVGSPGRLKHLIQNNHIDVSSVTLLVLDECDKLMEKSFLSDVNYIFTALPIQKQVIMSSATYPEHCMKFINAYVKCAQRVCTDSNSILVGIRQNVVTVPCNNNIVKQTNYKFDELLKILSNHQYKQCLIFCNYMARAVDIHKRLKKEMWPAELLHGQLNQTHRLNTLKALQQYKCRILISTDLAARGIDASNVDLVINFEPPYDWQTYLHRIGRAGRFGSYGIAVSILSEGKEVDKFKTTLRTMEIPIIIKKLWTGDEFNIKILGDDTTQNTQDIATIEETGIQHSINLWNLLTRKENKNLEPIQSFEELLKSHQEESKIYSFPDFLQSFENAKEGSDINEDDTYKYITLKEYDYNFKKENFHLNAKTLLNNNICINLENDIQTKNACQNQIEIDDNYFTNGNSYLNLNEKEIVSLSNDEIEYNSNDVEYTEGLLEGREHKSLTGTKHKKNIPKVIDKNVRSNKLVDNYEINCNSYDSGQENFIKPDICKSNQKTNFNRNIKRSKVNKTTLPQTDCEANKKSQLEIRTSLLISESHLANVKKPPNIHSRFDYNSWYSQFKMQVKYIEHSFYIEEMSKLASNKEA